MSPLLSITQGKTRLVILIGNYAIKIGKIRFLNLCIKCFMLIIKDKETIKNYKGKKLTITQSFYECLFAGLCANRIEADYYNSSRDSRIMPVLKKYLFGWIIIQPRGLPISKNETCEWYICEKVDRKLSDISEHRQFCRDNNGKVLLIDYGKKITVDTLSSNPS